MKRIDDPQRTKGAAILQILAEKRVASGVECSRYQTCAGQTLQRELFKAYLEDVIWGAWRQIQYEQIKLALSSASP